MSRRSVFALCVLLAIIACCTDLARVDVRAAARAADWPGYWGFDPANLGKTCKPCDDFFQFAMGGWMKSNPIPPEYSTWGSFTVLADKNQQGLRQMREATAKADAPSGCNERKIGDFYSSCMDTGAIDAAGIKPIEALLLRISLMKSITDLQATAARLQQQGLGALFRFTSSQDAKDSTQVIATALQGGLGLPERDYYLRTDEKSKKLRDDYAAHIAKMLGLLGDSSEKATAEAATVLTIETSLAKASMSNVDLRDPIKTYHKMKVADVQLITPGFSWDTYLRALGHTEVQELNVAQPNFFVALNGQLNSTHLEDWKTYFRWHVVDSAAPALPEKFVDEDFDFRGRILTGAKEIQPRWKRCVPSTDRNLGEALGQLYVQKYFPPEAKPHALEMAHNLIAALRADLETLPWMGAETRGQAAAKLEAFAVKIGYPDKWRDYSALKVDRSSYLANLQRSAEFEFQRRLNKIGKPVDRTDWGMRSEEHTSELQSPDHLVCRLLLEK